MLGLHQHWIHAGLQRTANFALIPPGQYTLELQSISSDGNWADAPITQVSITIIPPWYRSSLAWILYAGLFIRLVFAYVRYERRFLQLKYAEEINEKEIERLQSLDDFKTRFFGYISHEFKTPLTIILGQARRIETEKNHQNIVQNAGAIHQQGQSMLEMVTQMVDITRLDKKEIKLNKRNGEMSGYVRFLVESLRSLAEFKDIKLDFQTAVPVLMMDFDPLRVKFIVNNLLSNAIRHTPPGGYIGISISVDTQNQMLLEVSDTGEGIAPEDLPKIFERYYQGPSPEPQQQGPHFGIGLTFVKDLVELFGGTIAVSSQLGIGSRFVIALPVTQAAPAMDIFLPEMARMSDHLTGGLSDLSTDQSLPLLLIVEDNLFITNFIQYALEPHFNIEFARDSLSGYEMALKIVPDLILTDVMMPGIDGYELTNRLKSHELTNHIPIVMLSARSELSDRLTGQKHGANAYIGKPFDEQELVLTLKNLYQLQQQWRERYAAVRSRTEMIDLAAKTKTDQPAETVQQTDTFMLKLYAIFEKNYSNDAYNLLQLCRDSEMSKSQLQRKLIALSDLSSMELLRRYRLQKAYEILSEHPDYTVKEVCFMVGFKDPAHFSRLFSKMFHVAPSDIKKV
jgi:signal transduction histidine kinase/DNA-binding response OmpR family regulator